ncbi:protein kinase C delta type-like [Bufo bufo]|uniref:protein kinase C delta type-like n=1 Tax=Bufo bufo TaxID=8384 RepID=UPI001ABE6ED4|nr:protein kinase C delta type-like [Bufo bufo]
MTSSGEEDEEKRSEEEEKKMSGGEEKRKREDDSRQKDTKKKRIAPNARVLEDEEPRAGPSTAITPRANTRISISGFRFHQVLGRGSFGKVVLASVRGRNIYKAIKIIPIEDNAEALQRERQILLEARDCPFLCHLSAALQSQAHAYFIMEYLSGGSLESLIDMSGKLNIENVRFYTAEVICGLQFLHGHGIAHRDIKPANIMLDTDGHIRIIDLGLAQDGLTASTKIYGQAGTYRYMAPEVHLDQPYTVAADWWSLGVVVSKMSTGHFPFKDSHQMQLVYLAITKAKPRFPTWLEVDLKHLIKKLLRKDPERRLGVSGNIRDHPFFGTICWEELEMRRAQPPFRPFQHALERSHLKWPEDEPPLHPMSSFSFLSPSWTK